MRLYEDGVLKRTHRAAKEAKHLDIVEKGSGRNTNSEKDHTINVMLRAVSAYLNGASHQDGTS